MGNARLIHRLAIAALLLATPALAQTAAHSPVQVFSAAAPISAPTSSPTFSGTVTMPDGSTWGTGGLSALKTVSGLFTGTPVYVSPQAVFGAAGNDYSEIDVLAGGAGVGAFLGSDNVSAYVGSLTGLSTKINTAANYTQLEALHVASTRWVTVSGSVAGNPIIGVSAGSLNLNAALLTQGTATVAACTVAVAGATVTIKNGLITAFTGC